MACASCRLQAPIRRAPPRCSASRSTALLCTSAPRAAQAKQLSPSAQHPARTSLQARIWPLAFFTLRSLRRKYLGGMKNGGGGGVERGCREAGGRAGWSAAWAWPTPCVCAAPVPRQRLHQPPCASRRPRQPPRCCTASQSGCYAACCMRAKLRPCCSLLCCCHAVALPLPHSERQLVQRAAAATQPQPRCRQAAASPMLPAALVLPAALAARRPAALTRTWTWRARRRWPTASCGRSWAPHPSRWAGGGPPPGTGGTCSRPARSKQGPGGGGG